MQVYMKTNKYIKALLPVLFLASCSAMDEMVPEGSTITSDQVQNTTSAIPDRSEADVAGIYSYAGQPFAVLGASQGAHNDFGYPSICMAQDSNGPDMVCSNSGYNWFSVSYDYSDRQYNYIVCYLRYSFFYNQIKLCNDVLAPFAGMDYSAQAAESRHAIGQALAVRAFDYLGLAPYYQFRYADSKDLPCVPIVSETMTQEEYTDNPRASVETVYKKIIGDLTTAIELLADYSRGSDKTKVDRQVAYGLRARAYLSMGMYAEAAADAEMAMDGYTPYSMTEVGRPAFCNLTDHNWMWGILQESDQQGGLISWPSHLGSFTAVGYTTGTGVYKRINPLLYDKISDTDVRKGWWTNDRNTSPLLDEIEWNGVTGAAIATLEIPDVEVAFQNYTVVKFGMKSGIGSTDNASDWPIMRAEEMILTQAEGLAMSGHESEARQILENFVRTYRDPEYVCEATEATALQNEIWKQRRIELWGEGFSMFDIMRLKKPVVRIHGNSIGSWPNAYAFNIAPDDPYLLLRFPQQETNTNKGVSSLDNSGGSAPKPMQNGNLLDGVTD